MDFYHISDAYIAYLRGFDTSVSDNKHESRPYVGVVIQIDDMKYYAPLTSPKPKHQKMKNGKDFRKINGGQYGAINFNNMIPVPDNAVISMSINNEPDAQYRRLLQNQYQAVLSDFSEIEKTAKNLRDLVLTADEDLSPYDLRIKNRCCNLKKLEEVYASYGN